MTSKVCTNSKCPGYAHIVYTVEMRCLLCKWDLKAASREDLGLGRAKAPTTGLAGRSDGAHAVR